MRRQWRIDHTANIHEAKIWKGDPNKLPCPWVKVDERRWMLPKESLASGYHMIMKLTNLEWLEHVSESGRSETYTG